MHWQFKETQCIVFFKIAKLQRYILFLKSLTTFLLNYFFFKNKKNPFFSKLMYRIDPAGYDNVVVLRILYLCCSDKGVCQVP